MDLNVSEAAGLLGVDERTVREWIEERGLPALRVGDQYRIGRAALYAWAESRRISLSPARPARGLVDAVSRGGIFYDLPGETRQEILWALAQLPTLPELEDRELLYQLLSRREALGSTGVGGGVALPHPRDPLVLPLKAPAVIVAFLARPVDFGAGDGRPVRVLFAVLAPTIQAHLDALSRLAAALKDEDFAALVEAAAPADDLLERLRALEG
jgi:PTS system nitrogen regulatory IIA component